MTKTILITRPKGDEAALTDMLHAHGYRVIHEPLTEIVLRHTERLAVHHALMEEPDVVIVTSRHGVHALAMLTELRDMFLLCVGEATAQAAYSQGFTRVDIAGGTVQSLIDKIASVYEEGTKIFYPSGEHTRVNLDDLLASMSMEVKRIVVYEAMAVEHLSDTLIVQLHRKQIDAVTFMSPRAAQIFTTLLAKAEIPSATNHLQAIALSENIANFLIAQSWKGIHIAGEPTLASLAECVDNVFK